MAIYSNQFIHLKMKFSNSRIAFVFMANGSSRKWELEEVEGPCVSQRKAAANNLHCSGVPLRLGHHCSNAHFNCHQQHSSQERPTKIPTIPMWSLYFTDAYPSEEAVSKIIANSLSSLWYYSSLRQLVEVQASHASWPSTIETPGWCRKVELVPRMFVLD